MPSQKIISKLEWHFQQISERTNISNLLIEQCSNVCADGFGIISPDWIMGNRERLSKSTFFGQLLDSKGALHGIAYYSISDQAINNSHILWEDGICLVKSCQHQGYSRSALQKAVSLFPELQIKWLGCRTQNPAMMLRYSKLGRLLPFDDLYDSFDGVGVMNFLIENINAVRKVYQSGKLDLTNGICRQLYSQGRLGDYSVDLLQAGAFEERLQEWRFERERGDAIILTVALSKQL